MSRMADGIDEALRLAGRLVALAAATGVVFFLLGIAFKPVFPDGLPLGDAGRLIYLLLLVMALLVAQVLMVALAERGDWGHTGLGRHGWSPRALALGFGLGALVAGLLPVLAHYTGTGEPGAAAWTMPTAAVLQVVALSALVDSLLLRGYAFGLLASRWGEAAAIALTALVATLLAVRGEAPTAEAAGRAVLLATFLGVLRARTGSLPAALLAHLAVVLVAAGTAPGRFLATASLFAAVTFLMLTRLPRTARPGRRLTTSGA